MSTPGVLATGFPGFIAGRLLRRWLSDLPADTPFYFLVEPRFVFQARDRCAALEAEVPPFAGRWKIVEGDIRQPSLGMSQPALDEVRERVGYVWHLAAIYHLGVPLPAAYAVNVEGTLEVLDLCERLPKLQTLFYVSTCYVAGDRTGRVYEDELDKGQGFKNHYESTKFWAEKHVRRRMGDVPTVVFRPAVVVGDSKTGETQKGDGPYYIIRLLQRLPKWLPMVHLGPATAPVTLVPVDWLVDAMAVISQDPKARGKTFQLADPAPLTAREILDLCVEVMGRAPVVGRLPLSLVEPASRLRQFSQATQIPAEALAYFNHPVTFDVTQTAEHVGKKLGPVPRLDRYLATLIDYAERNPHIF